MKVHGYVDFYMRWGAKHEMERLYLQWKERAVLESLKKIVRDYPDLTQCVFFEQEVDFVRRIAFVGTDEHGLYQLPNGVNTCYIVDLVKYKQMVADGTIPNNTNQLP